MSLCRRDVVEKRKEVVRAEQERKEWLENESKQNTKRDFLKMCLLTTLYFSIQQRHMETHTTTLLPATGIKLMPRGIRDHGGPPKARAGTIPPSVCIIFPCIPGISQEIWCTLGK